MAIKLRGSIRWLIILSGNSALALEEELEIASDGEHLQ